MMYCNRQLHIDFSITLYNQYVENVGIKYFILI